MAATKSINISDQTLECGRNVISVALMIFDARQGGLSISEIAELLGFSHKTFSRVCREWCGGGGGGGGWLIITHTTFMCELLLILQQ